MNEDARDARIARAARAHADARDGHSDRAAATRARILATHRASARRSTLWLAAAAALVVFVGAPTAWAWWTGALPAWLDPEPTSPPATPQATPEATASEPTPPTASAGHELSSEETSDPPSEESSDATSDATDGTRELAAREPRRDGAPTTSDETSDDASDETSDEAAPADPRERRMFEHADALHTARETERALEAWDGYLATYPRGRFAIEARYERAICLLRLGRRDEAREALSAFAEGRYGRYREREARALIDALGEASQP